MGFPIGGNEGALGGYISGEPKKTGNKIEKPRFSNQRRGFSLKQWVRYADLLLCGRFNGDLLCVPGHIPDAVEHGDVNGR